MCGIYASISRSSALLPDDAAIDALRARGPDSFQVKPTVLQSRDGKQNDQISLVFASSVLALRGDHVQTQPLTDDSTGCILCWNGEAWKLGDQKIVGNDSRQVFNALLSASRSTSDSSTQISEVLTNIAGPFAFVYFDALSSNLYFGRDRLGRRSLLTSVSDTSSLILASIGVGELTKTTSEVPVDAIHCISLKDSALNVHKVPWNAGLPAINKVPPTGQPLPFPSDGSVNSLLLALRAAIELRVMDIPDHSHSQLSIESAKVAVLFSGGLDCTLLARLAHDILPENEPVDLLNVAFENPRSVAASGNSDRSPYEACPDRVTGRSSFAELCDVCPGRPWRFVTIDIPYSETIEHRSAIVRLMYPHNTEMDISIAMALYFAARGQGQMWNSDTNSNPPTPPTRYVSSARALLSGLGADELFAGYSRHSAAFARSGFSGIADELELDFTRIGTRNLGRDDRMMSHWGKEVRYPFLDESFVRYTLSLPVWEKCGFRPNKAIPKHYEESRKVECPEDLEPAKMALRLAAWKLGMKKAATERKRAIQFGARTAKMEIGQGRKKGTDALSID